MVKTIAVAGKGGTGKTTLTGLIIRWLVEHKETPVLAVDADPNTNLNQVLGVQVENTIGSLREEILTKIDEIPAGVPKETFLEYRIQEILVEATDFDLLAMGRQEGPGCYCYINNVLRRYVDELADNYKTIVIDNEAGMEHLSRRTTREVDLLLMISGPSPRGIMTTQRLRELAKELDLEVKKTKLVVNRVKGGKLPELLEERVKQTSLEIYR